MTLQNLFKTSIKKSPKTYLYLLPLTAINYLPQPFDINNNLQFILMMIIFIILGILMEYYSQIITILSLKKDKSIRKIKQIFIKKAKTWLKTVLLALLLILKWGLPTLITSTIGFILINPQYHLVTNIIGGLIILASAYFGYKTIIEVISLSMSNLIAIDGKQEAKQNIKNSRKITEGKKLLIFKIGVIAASVTTIVSLSSLFILQIDPQTISQAESLSILNYVALSIYILIENLLVSFNLNIFAQTYKMLKK